MNFNTHLYENPEKQNRAPDTLDTLFYSLIY